MPQRKAIYKILYLHIVRVLSEMCSAAVRALSLSARDNECGIHWRQRDFFALLSATLIRDMSSYLCDLLEVPYRIRASSSPIASGEVEFHYLPSQKSIESLLAEMTCRIYRTYISQRLDLLASTQRCYLASGALTNDIVFLNTLYEIYLFSIKLTARSLSLS